MRYSGLWKSIGVVGALAISGPAFASAPIQCPAGGKVNKNGKVTCAGLSGAAKERCNATAQDCRGKTLGPTTVACAKGNGNAGVCVATLQSDGVHNTVANCKCQK